MTHWNWNRTLFSSHSFAHKEHTLFYADQSVFKIYIYLVLLAPMKDLRRGSTHSSIKFLRVPYYSSCHEMKKHVCNSSGRMNLEDESSLHIPLFDIYQFSFLVGFATIGAIFQGTIERLTGTSGAQQCRIWILAEGLRLVNLVTGLWTIFELENDQYDQNNGDQRRGYDADY